ncbi:archaeal Glu-tRNAGln amidotransferase subunit D/asparaginase [Cenarchaeum symbiosum A]|uniref:Glutamyl-tRNA(Gln) amidotransferase subunit D n=1 Tax=Cenarchaeum symbiosum (strain A) TaxID=414004 RepID=A0RZ07_CENSY|nr:archaeal Glu-tRNAGln amidotransferase subunit D/asparaginase [Cenarchaeum symbiosum A]
MPRYEGGGDRLVLKLDSGYNVGIELGWIKGVEKLPDIERPAAAAAAAPAPAGGLPKVLLLSTGGTIASRIDYRTGAVTPALGPEEIYQSVPELAKIAEITPRVIFSEHSENLQPDHWKKIAEELHAASGEGFGGVIVAHGTDTMQYTASYLSFALSGFPAPVALVGSQRSPDRPSSDAAQNLAAAASFLTQVDSGIYVVMHLDGNDGASACHLGTRVRKNHTSKRGAFQTVGGSPAYTIRDGRLEAGPGDRLAPGEYRPRIAVDPRASLVKYHPGYDPAVLDSILDAGARGIIFEGTGLGHVGRQMYEAVGRAAEKGVFMGMTSQCIDGRVSMTVYESGRDLLGLGITPLGDMLSETALVKLMWALGIKDDIKGVRNIMLDRIAGEFSPGVF